MGKDYGWFSFLFVGMFCNPNMWLLSEGSQLFDYFIFKGVTIPHIILFASQAFSGGGSDITPPLWRRELTQLCSRVRSPGFITGLPPSCKVEAAHPTLERGSGACPPSPFGSQTKVETLRGQSTWVGHMVFEQGYGPWARSGDQKAGRGSGLLFATGLDFICCTRSLKGHGGKCCDVQRWIQFRFVF